MRNILILLSLILFTSCGTTNSMKKENKNLMDQSSTLQSKFDKLTTDNSKLSSSIATLEQKSRESSAKLRTCNAELNNVKTFYSAYKIKLSKIKSELLAAFPNNLNEPNFSVREEDGRLIVTIPNKIIYPRGSADFNSDALMVIQRLSTVFSENQNINILVEGHTDDTAIKRGSQYKDNWDLSVARAVKIVRQFATYGVYPQQLTAAGRGYYSPISRLDTEEARAMNRRTEIIIRPKIADLLKMIDELN